MVRRILKNRTARNAGWLIGGRMAQMLVNLVVGLLTARYLGPANYGLIHYAGAYTAFFSAFCNLGIHGVLVKELMDHPRREGEVIGTSLLLRGVASALSALTILGIVLIADQGEQTTILVVGLSSLGMLLQSFEVINFWFQSRLQSKVTALASLGAYVVTAGYKVFLLVSGKSVVWFALAASVDHLCIGALLLWAYRKQGGRRLCASWSYGKALLGRSCHFILPSLMVAVYGQTDKLMLRHMMGDAEVGYYSTAVSLCGVWCFVLSAIIDSACPGIMEASEREEKLFERRNRQLYAIVFYLSGAVSLCFALFGEWAIWLLYGEAYLPAAAPLRIITWYTAFSYLGVARNAWVVCKNRQSDLIYVYGAAAVSNVALNVLLIPRWGASGAAAASLAAQIVTTMVAPWCIPGLRENTKLMADAIRLRGIREE